MKKFKNVNDFAVEVSKKEGKKKQVSIANIKEVLKVSNELLGGYFYKLIKNYGKKDCQSIIAKIDIDESIQSENETQTGNSTMGEIIFETPKCECQDEPEENKRQKMINFAIIVLLMIASYQFGLFQGRYECLDTIKNIKVKQEQVSNIVGNEPNELYKIQ